jgi:hypothetical protein
VVMTVITGLQYSVGAGALLRRPAPPVSGGPPR